MHLRGLDAVGRPGIALPGPARPEPLPPDLPQRPVARDLDLRPELLGDVLGDQDVLVPHADPRPVQVSARTAKIASRICSVMLGCPPPGRSHRPSVHPAGPLSRQAAAIRSSVRSLTCPRPSSAASLGRRAPPARRPWPAAAVPASWPAGRRQGGAPRAPGAAGPRCGTRSRPPAGAPAAAARPPAGSRVRSSRAGGCPAGRAGISRIVRDGLAVRVMRQPPDAPPPLLPARAEQHPAVLGLDAATVHSAPSSSSTDPADSSSSPAWPPSAAPPASQTSDASPSGRDRSMPEPPAPEQVQRVRAGDRRQRRRRGQLPERGRPRRQRPAAARSCRPSGSARGRRCADSASSPASTCGRQPATTVYRHPAASAASAAAANALASSSSTSSAGRTSISHRDPSRNTARKSGTCSRNSPAAVPNRSRERLRQHLLHLPAKSSASSSAAPPATRTRAAAPSTP